MIYPIAVFPDHMRLTKCVDYLPADQVDATIQGWHACRHDVEAPNGNAAKRLANAEHRARRGCGGKA